MVFAVGAGVGERFHQLIALGMLNMLYKIIENASKKLMWGCMRYLSLDSVLPAGDRQLSPSGKAAMVEGM